MSRSWADALRSALTLDLRGLALLRTGLALVLLFDALSRPSSAGLLYADAGLLPRGDAILLAESGRLSLHLINGSVLFAGLLCMAQILAATALLIGWRTRTASLLCWLLAISAAVRNPLVATPGDAYAIALLTWALFLPWGARWSVDGARSRNEVSANEHFSPAGAVLLLQVLALPLFSALALSGADWGGAASAEGTEASWFSLATIRPLLGAGIEFLQWLILPLALLPLMGVLPRRVALVAFLFVAPSAFAAGSPGTLPWLGLLSAVLLIDPALWEQLPSDREQRIYLDRDDHGGRRALQLVLEFMCLSATPLLASQDSPRAARLTQTGPRLVLIDDSDVAHLDGDALRRIVLGSPLLLPVRWLLASPALAPVYARWLRFLLRRRPNADSASARAPLAVLGRDSPVQAVAVVLGVLSLIWQLGAVNVLPSSLQTWAGLVLQPLVLDRSWTWFAPAPTRVTAWIAAPGERADGRPIDALARPGTDADRGPNFQREQVPLLAGLRGRYYEHRLAQGYEPARLALARRLCRVHGASLARVRIVLMVQAPTAAIAEQRVLLRHECAGADSAVDS